MTGTKRKYVPVLLALMGLALSLAAADDKTKEPGKPVTWSGLGFDKAVAKLPNKVEKKLPMGPFAAGVITNAKDFKAFVTQQKMAPRDKPDPVWQKWQKAINWEREAVVYVVLMKATNSLKMGAWEAPKDGTATLKLRWSSIEPFYGPNYPTVLARVPRRDLEKVRVIVNDTEFGAVPIGKK